MKKTLPIGTVAKMLGMSSEALRFYERKRIVDITADIDNGYRHYERAAVTHLMKARYLKSMDFSLTEVNEQNSQGITRVDDHAYMKGIPLSRWLDTVDERKRQLKTEIEQKQRILSALCRYQAQVERIQTLHGKYRIENSPEMLFVQFSDEENLMSTAQDFVDQIKKCVDLFPISRYGFVCPQQQLCCNGANVRRGLLIPGDEKPNLDACANGVLRFGVTLCLHTIVSLDVNTAASSSMLSDALCYLSDHRFDASGDAYGMWIANAQDGTRNGKYYEVWIPICDR